MASGRIKSENSMVSPVYYDTDTGYYIDAASTGEAARLRGRALIGPNNSWGKYLQVGGNGREYVNNGDVASVVTTNGNYILMLQVDMEHI